jgi:hypothetical protein
VLLNAISGNELFDRALPFAVLVAAEAAVAATLEAHREELHVTSSDFIQGQAVSQGVHRKARERA